MKKVLVLGAGLVSRPGVQYLLNQKNIEVTVASRTVSKAEKLIEGFTNGKAVQVNVENKDDLVRVIKDCDIAISLLPWIHHLKVAELCVEYGKNMVTTSYVSEGMRKLDEVTKQKGLLFLNELGVDPGIDHMSAMKIIDEIHAEGGKILHFYSYCGGLPAPEDNNNPFGYKFSWSPRGVVLASRNSAKFKENGQIVNIEGKNLFANPKIEEIEGLGKFEVYPNRDSTPYEEIYGLQEALTVKRGTYRNIGWCQTFKKLVDLGMIDETFRDELKGITFRKMMADLIGCDVKDDVKAKVAEKINLPVDHEVLGRFEWLGLFSNEKVSTTNNRLDILSDRLQEKLTFNDGEKDLLILRHKFVIENKDKTKDIYTSTLIDFGIPFGDSSMARTVSLPMAIGTRLLAEGKLSATGVKIPTTPDLYKPILAELETLGIKMKELRKRI